MKCHNCGFFQKHTGGPKWVILGTGHYGDTIEVECPECQEFYELEPDGLGQGGMEWVEAKMKDEGSWE